MEKHELFRNALEEQQAFENYDASDLLTIGVRIGSNEVVFKQLYKAYMNGDSTYEYNPRRGAKIEVSFNLKNDEVIIEQLTKEFKFTEELFLSYLNLASLCYSAIHPMGSVIELDEEMLDDEFKKAFVKEGEPLLAMITGCRVSLPDELEEYIADYVGRIWPYGEGEERSFFISTLMVKRVVHGGYIDEESDESLMMSKLEELILDQKKLMTFLTSKEEEMLAVEVMKNMEEMR